MRNNISKTENKQIPSKQGVADETNTKLLELVAAFFGEATYDDAEEVFSDLVQVYVDPDPRIKPTGSTLANTLYSIRRISNMLRKLEMINRQLKGGVSC
jgi:hypothetical protein